MSDLSKLQNWLCYSSLLPWQNAWLPSTAWCLTGPALPPHSHIPLPPLTSTSSSFLSCPSAFVHLPSTSSYCQPWPLPHLLMWEHWSVQLSSMSVKFLDYSLTLPAKDEEFHAFLFFSLDHMEITTLFKNDVCLFFSSTSYWSYSVKGLHDSTLYSSSIWYCPSHDFSSKWISSFAVIYGGKSHPWEDDEGSWSLTKRLWFQRVTMQDKLRVHLKVTVQDTCVVYPRATVHDICTVHLKVTVQTYV